MEDALGFIIVFVIFVLAPLLEQFRKKQAPPPAPKERRPLPRPQAGPRPEYVEPRGTTARNQEAPASEMLSDELWKVLSGQERPRPVSLPEPPDVEEESSGLEEAYRSENLPTEIERGRKVEAVTRAEVKRSVPYVVSMETMPDPKARHAAFHQKVAVVEAKPVNRHQKWLQSRDEMRRAIILQTILGSPKGLE